MFPGVVNVVSEAASVGVPSTVTVSAGPVSANRIVDGVALAIGIAKAAVSSVVLVPATLLRRLIAPAVLTWTTYPEVVVSSHLASNSVTLEKPMSPRSAKVSAQSGLLVGLGLVVYLAVPPPSAEAAFVTRLIMLQPNACWIQAIPIVGARAAMLALSGTGNASAKIRVAATGFHLATAHHGITALETMSVNSKAARSKVARNGGLYWFDGVTQTVAPSAGKVFGRGFQTRATGYFFFGLGFVGGFLAGGPVGIARSVLP